MIVLVIPLKAHLFTLFVAVFLGFNQYWPGESMVFVVLRPGAPEGSTGSGSGFKAPQKTGPLLKVSSDRLGEALYPFTYIANNVFPFYIP